MILPVYNEFLFSLDIPPPPLLKLKINLSFYLFCGSSKKAKCSFPSESAPKKSINLFLFLTSLAIFEIIISRNKVNRSCLGLRHKSSKKANNYPFGWHARLRRKSTITNSNWKWRSLRGASDHLEETREVSNGDSSIQEEADIIIESC